MVASEGKSALTGVWNFGVQNCYWSRFFSSYFSCFVVNVLNVPVQIGYTCIQKHMIYCTNPPLKYIMINPRRGESIIQCFYSWLFYSPSRDPPQLLQETSCFCVIPNFNLSRDFNMGNNKPVISCSVAKGSQRNFLYCVLKLWIFVPLYMQKDGTRRTEFFCM